ncbi:MAG TPA: hypothetical protein VKU01_13880 [Bryobacteraceae bacterium]|nr:hypothetical protein [Bryobacteraceae bacterium]
MTKADSAKVTWDTDKKHWVVRVQIGEEVVKRALPKCDNDATDEVIRPLAVQTAKDDGYEVAPESVVIVR